MDTRTVIAIGVLVLVLLVAVPMIRRSQIEGQCAQLMAERSRRSVQGANQTELEQLDADIRTCQQAARAAGSKIDPSAGDLSVARSDAQLITSEWGNYRATGDCDLAKRNDTRDAVLRAERRVVDDLRRAVAAAETLDGLRAIERFTIGEIRASVDRARCFLSGDHGCSRCGIDEPDWDERARDELLTYAFPLGARQAVESGAWSPVPSYSAEEWIAGGPQGIDAAFRGVRRLGDERDRSLLRIGALRRIFDENPGQAGRIVQAWRDSTDTVYAAILAKRSQLSGFVVTATGFQATPAMLALASALRSARAGA